MDGIIFTNGIQIFGPESNHSIGTLLEIPLSDIYLYHSEMSFLICLLLPVEQINRWTTILKSKPSQPFCKSARDCVDFFVSIRNWYPIFYAFGLFIPL